MATRAQVETIIVKRCGPMMTLATMDGMTVDGTNADLNDPIGWSVRALGGTVSNPTSVSAADVATVSSEYLDQLLDLTELRTLRSVLTNLELVDIDVGPRSEKFSQLVERIAARIAELSVDLAAWLLPGLEDGILSLDFAEHVTTT
ncbi:MAG: hypothetical protein JXA14_26045 [Anaerolineae bacterium]|nr:hypothetical protein [Anaerolineae bacterium]